jgi:hypothetical protein
MLDRDDIEPLLEMITSAEDIGFRLAGLDAITRFSLTEQAWRAVGPALRGELADTVPGSPERDTAIELAAAAPLASVRAELTAISEAQDNPDGANVRRILRQPSANDVDRLVRRLESNPGDLQAGAELAALPIESVRYDHPSQRELKKRLRRLASSRSSDARFWASLALGRLGDNRALDQMIDRVLSRQDENPSVFWGSPWTAYDRLAMMRPVPDGLRVHLLDWLRNHPGEPGVPDRYRDARILAWALTGSADAQGLPISDVVPEGPAAKLEVPEEAGANGGGPEPAASESGQGITAPGLVEQTLAVVLEDAHPDYETPLAPLTTEQAITVLMRAIHLIAQGETSVQDDQSLPARGERISNNLVQLAGNLPAPTDLPVREIYHTLRSVLPDQTAWILSRSPASELVAQFTQELPTIEPPDQIDILHTLALAGDYQRGKPKPLILGAGPTGTTPPIESAALIDDLGSASPEPSWDYRLEFDTGQWAAVSSAPSAPASGSAVPAALSKPGLLHGTRRWRRRKALPHRPVSSAGADKLSESQAESTGAGAPPSGPEPVVLAAPGPGLLGEDGAGDRPEATETAPSPGSGGAQPDQRFFLAELESHPKDQPVRQGDQYTIAFSVGPPLDTAIAESPFPDELLAAEKGVDVFDLTVQLDSNDFEIFSEPTQRLRVPRAGRSLGKARFDIAPRHDGDCQLAASVHYKGNFLHQMNLTILVGDQQPAEIDVSTRGRPADSAATLKPRDISILLEPAPAGGFWCTALGSVAGRAVLPITATELNTAVASARDAMMDVIKSVSAGELVFQSGIHIPPAAADAALRTLARAGSRLFQQLFLHPAAGADARRAGEWLRGYAMNPGLRLHVQVFAYQAPLPWAMLYLGDASDGAKLDWNNFLGMRHVVEQLPLQMSLETVDNEIPSTPELSLSVNVNITIDQSMKVTLVAGHRQHWKDAAAARPGLSLQTRTTKSEVVHALADGHTGDQVVYFYCHAKGVPASGNPDDAAIIMGNNDAATVADLNIDAPTTVQLPGNPLVFINACESAELSPLFYSGFVPYFMAKGARGVIGTECKTPALFAVKWADAFFNRFLDGAPVGETVLELRREFIAEHGNPLGLIYAVHCDADTRIAPALSLIEAG